jgi:hypothetical protein
MRYQAASAALALAASQLQPVIPVTRSAQTHVIPAVRTPARQPIRAILAQRPTPAIHARQPTPAIPAQRPILATHAIPARPTDPLTTPALGQLTIKQSQKNRGLKLSVSGPCFFQIERSGIFMDSVENVMKYQTIKFNQ